MSLQSAKVFILVLTAIAGGTVLGCLISMPAQYVLYATAVFVSFSICNLIMLAIVPPEDSE